MNSGAAAGGKRPAEGQPGQYVPRKRPANEDEELEEDFDLVQPDDDDDLGADMEASRRW